MKKYLIITGYIFSALLSVAQSERTHQIEGIVQIEGERPDANIWVTAVQIFDLAKMRSPQIMKPVNVHAQVNSDGTFRVEGLPAGKYNICTQVLSREFLNGCAWQIYQEVTIAESNTQVNLTLQKGHQIKLLIEDSKELRSKVKREVSDSPYLEPEMEFSVLAEGGIIKSFTLVSNNENETQSLDPNTIQYEALVPFDRPVQVLMSSKVFSIQDESTSQIFGRDVAEKSIAARSENAESVYRFSLDAIQPGKEK